jgi:predicted DNA-binding transcriptional regulator YafY
VTAVYQVEALVDAPAGTVRERYGRWATVEEASPGTDGTARSRIRMTADQLEWPMLLLGGAGAEFEVISPPELLDLVRDWGRRFTRAGTGTAGTAG